MISKSYLNTFSRCDFIEVIACCDLDKKRAEEIALSYNIPRVYDIEDFFQDNEIELVVNLTVPSAHGEIHLRALHAGKHTFGEKPLAANTKEGKEILDLAAKKGLRVGSAPDTFLGAGIQMCQQIIDDGQIGEPVGATAFMMSHGPESFHPRPQFLYQSGAGPLFDMGPYYLTAMIALLGPVKKVTASANMRFTKRMITASENYGEWFAVSTPTNVASILDFHNGSIGNMIMSFDVWGTGHEKLEIYGTKGTISVPDPNRFSGEVKLQKEGEAHFSSYPITSGYIDNTRGIGVIDMVRAIFQKKPHRASGELAFHVLEIMESVLKSSQEARHCNIQSICDKPVILPVSGIQTDQDTIN